MKRNDVLKVLDEIEDRYIEEAEKAPVKKIKKPYWMGLVAAVLVVVICIGIFSDTAKITAEAVALRGEARITEHPDLDDYENREDYLAEVEKWRSEGENRRTIREKAAYALSDFFTAGSREFLISKEGENALWSPINAYIGLSMLSEITVGESQKEILRVLGVEDKDTLRQQTGALWESVYEDDGNEICTLANSLWLEDGLGYRQETMDALAYHHYASIYKGDLGSDKTDKAIGEWLSENTGGLLKDSTDKIDLTQDIVLAIYSTLYFQAKWEDEFDEKNNTEGIFRSAKGDTKATYMNRKLYQMDYYWESDFSAVSLRLKNGSTMWFILPDEGKTPDDILKGGAYGDLFLPHKPQEEMQNKKYMKVNLSVPKFDVSSTLNLKEGLQKMGVTKVFDMDNSDFTAITSDTPVYITAVNQSARVEIDEKGVKAATYIEFPAAGSAMPPEEIIDFVLDRPFVFAITKNNLPLFTGVVNNV